MTTASEEVPAEEGPGPQTCSPLCVPLPDDCARPAALFTFPTVWGSRTRSAVVDKR